MRYLQFLAAFVALILATACVHSEVDDRPLVSAGSNGQLQVVGRITQYADCDVATRSKKDGDEPKVTSMGLALFPIQNGTIGNCAYYEYKEGGSIVFVVDRHDDVFKNYADGTAFAMYIFANMQGATDFPRTAEAGAGKSLDDFKKCAHTVSVDVENVPENGFPMMGSIGDNVSANDRDGKILILKPATSTSNPDGLPLVNGTATDNLEIPLKSLYAKFSFTISSKPDQEIVGNKAPRFDLTGYTVHNVPTTVDGDSSTNSDTAVMENTTDNVISGKYAQGATVATFDFYLPERYLTPAKEDINEVLPDELKEGSYDEVVDKDHDGYRDEDEKYHQRFKNLLPGNNQKATYITIEGKYTDHQGHVYDVNYNIYLGGNNTDNFDVIRNTHYNNTVTIRGIANSNDQALNENGIAIDWRVDVERSSPLVINFRRETLLDAHYEVRPLRLRLVGESIPTGTSATVEILNANGTTTDIPAWIRMEKSGNTNAHIADGVSKGKRKYFTTDLVSETLKDGTTLSFTNLSRENSTLWIYVDENTDTKSRAAIVRITYEDANGSTAKDFKIVQNGLYQVVGAYSGNTYYIEQYEEYLYNYDAEEYYGQTEWTGMQWGLNNVQLSKEHNSFHIDENNDDWNSYVQNTDLLKYDFYIGKYDTFVDSNNITVHNYAGQHFTSKIFENSNGNVKELTMAEQPDGAVEYCYNRNKRDANGKVVKVEWYLPSADELEDFIVPAYSSFKEFQDNYYWTSQPAYIRNAFYYQYRYGSSRYDGEIEDAYAFVSYEDNTKYARATKVVALGGDQYAFALSGLKKTPDQTHAMDDNCISQNAQLLDGSYFNVMYAWYRWNTGTEEVTFTNDEHFNPIKDYNSYGSRIHVHNGHLYDMIQEGYHLRTKSNRVRCVRKDPAAVEEEEPTIVVDVTSHRWEDKNINNITSEKINFVLVNNTIKLYVTVSSNVVPTSVKIGGTNATKSATSGNTTTWYIDNKSWNSSGVKTMQVDVNVGDTTYSENISVSVASVSSTAATSLDENSVYVMRNTQYATRYLTTSGTNVAASSANATVDYYGLVKVEGNSKIKSVVKGTYFNGTNGNVSFNTNGTSYSINKSNNSYYTISYTVEAEGWFSDDETYYLRQGSNSTTINMSTTNNRNTWNFYEVVIP